MKPVQFLLDSSAIREREECTLQITRWLIARKFCRTEQAARHLAEQILAGNQDALAEE